MITTTRPTPARWNNTGGDVRVHLVPAGTVLLEGDDSPHANFFQITTPLCGGSSYHGGWSWITEMRPPLTLCRRCFS